MISRPLMLLLAIFMLIKLLFLPGRGGGLIIEFYDVGQGDAIFIKTPEGRSIVIDGGPDFEVDRHLDKRSLLNDCRLDMLVLTHPHQDHLKGLSRLVERCRVDYVVHRVVEYESYGYEEWLSRVEGLKLIDAVSGQVLDLGLIKLVIVWPPKDQDFEENINNSSVSILLDHGEFEALFLGDLEKEASMMIDHKLFDEYVDGRLEVYKVPHHGSIDSFNPELIYYLEPELCVVSVGENKYGHPSDEVLDFLINEGCEVKRTDIVGTIELFIN